MSDAGTPIRNHPENPHYFLYRGRPLVLITATEHYGAVINRNFDYVRYLDEAADKRATLSRCFLLFRELEHTPLNPHSPCKPRPGEYVAPFARTGPGYATDGYLKFDLDQWDVEFFRRLNNFLMEAARRDIIVELTLFSNTYSDLVWNLNPFNIKNNVNGVGRIAAQDYNSMVDAALFERQKAYVRKIVREVNAYDNMYLEVCNEPLGGHAGHVSAGEVDAWQDAIRGVIREEEAELPKQHLIFQNAVRRSRGYSPLDPYFSEESIDAITCHSGERLSYGRMLSPPLATFMNRDLNLAGIIQLWDACHEGGKPLVFDEDNSCTNGLDEESWTIHRKRAWTTVCSGGHYDMIDFSMQAAGQEAGTPAARAHIRTWMKHLSTFIHGVDFVHAVPERDFCSQVPPDTVAATLANPGREYVIYVADKREKGEPGQGEPCSGTLAFNLPAGKYDVQFYGPSCGAFTEEARHLDGGEVSLPLGPFAHDIVVHVLAEV